MIKLFRKNTGVTHELQGTHMSSTNKGAGTYNSKKRDVVWKKKNIWKSLFGKKHHLGKPVYFSVKNIANKADTGVHLWGEYVIWLFLLICSLNYSHHKYNTKLYNHVKEME